MFRLYLHDPFLMLKIHRIVTGLMTINLQMSTPLYKWMVYFIVRFLGCSMLFFRHATFIN